MADMPRNKFDPRLSLPPVVGAEYDGNTVSVPQYVDGSPEYLTPPEQGLRAPDSAVIIEQVIRRGPGGNDVIDLIMEVEDVPGATEVEIRVTDA